MTTFVCRVCGRELPESDRSRTRGGDRCKECWSDYMRAWYAKRTPEQRQQIVARVHRYRERELFPVLETRLRTHKKNPSKTSARRCVEAALAAGLLTKPSTCESCGKEVGWMKDGRANIHAHHHDHITDPIGVQWLCPSCHYVADDRRRRIAS